MEPLVLSPTDFIAVTNQVLETSFGFIYIQGEISEFRISKQKWVYFDLKDEFSKVRCFGSVFALPGPLQDGMVVRVSGSPKMHPQFGFSFTFQSIQAVGEGSLQKAFVLLKNKLAKEGLFDSQRKRIIPKIPQKLALITSVESAAYADFIKIANVRWPFIEIITYDTLVQGEQAPQSIVRAIEKANSETEPADVVVITRGGGAADDLAAFNDERVVRAVAASRVPTLVAIGHEIDESLSELTADLRASTPSNAAELLLPDRSSELQEIFASKRHLAKSVLGAVAIETSTINWYKQNLINLLAGLINTEKETILSQSKLLKSYSPNNVLNRGYAIIKGNDKVVSTKASSQKYQELDIVFKDGIVKTRKV